MPIDATVNIGLVVDTKTALTNLEALKLKLEELQGLAQSIAVPGSAVAGGSSTKPPKGSPASTAFAGNMDNANQSLASTKTEFLKL